jgi:hypothetical protein
MNVAFGLIGRVMAPSYRAEPDPCLENAATVEPVCRSSAVFSQMKLSKVRESSRWSRFRGVPHAISRRTWDDGTVQRRKNT